MIWNYVFVVYSKQDNKYFVGKISLHLIAGDKISLHLIAEDTKKNFNILSGAPTVSFHLEWVTDTKYS